MFKLFLLNSLAVGGASAAEIDSAIQAVWPAGTNGNPVPNFIAAPHLQQAGILAEQQRLAPLSEITLPTLREALQEWAGKTALFSPNSNDVKRLNKALVENTDLQTAILSVWPKQPATVANQNNPPVDFIRTHENKDALLSEHKASRVAEDIKAEITKTSNYPAGAHPELMRLIDKLPHENKESILQSAQAPAPQGKPKTEDKLLELLSATSEFELLAAARDCGFDASSIDSASGQALIDENLRNREFLQLANAKVAEILGRFPIALQPNTIKDLNAVMVATAAARVPFNNLAGQAYDAFVDALYNATGLSTPPVQIDRAAFKEAFGIATPPAAQTAPLDAIQTAVKAQHTQNQYFYAKINAIYNPVPPLAAGQPAITKQGELAALLALARLEKDSTKPAITTAEIDILTTALENNDTYGKFIKSANVNPLLSTHIKDFGTTGEKMLRGNFEQVQKEYAREKISTTGQISKDELARQEAIYQALAKPHQALVDTKVKDKFEPFVQLAVKERQRRLQNITELHPLAWLDSANEAIARQYATELLPEFEELNTLCTEICEGLQAQLSELNKLKASLPKDAANEGTLESVFYNNEQSKVKDQLAKVNQAIEMTNLSLQRYQLVHTWLNGDPRVPIAPNDFGNKVARTGMLGVLRDAKELKKLSATELTSAKPNVAIHQSGFVDVACADQTAIKTAVDAEITKLKTAVPVVGNGNAQAQTRAAETKRLFENQGVLAEGDIRIRTVFTERSSPGTAAAPPSRYAGIYYEQDGKPRDKSSGDRGSLEQPITMTVSVYPTENPAPAANSAEERELRAAQVEFVTKMAMSMLVRMGKPPTAADPIVLTGGDKEQVGMLWAALVQLGKLHPQFKFNEDAIRVSAACFDPKEEKNFFGRPKDGSFTKRFTDGASGDHFTAVATGMKTGFFDKAFGANKNEQKALAKNVEDFRSYKGKITDARKAVKPVIDELKKPPTPKP